MANEEKNLRELAGRIYDLDEEVYRELGSSLGRVFNGKREDCIEETVRSGIRLISCETNWL